MSSFSSSLAATNASIGVFAHVVFLTAGMAGFTTGWNAHQRNCVGVNFFACVSAAYSAAAATIEQSAIFEAGFIIRWNVLPRTELANRIIS